MRTMTDIQGRVFDVAIRDRVMQHMAYRGSEYHRVSDDLWVECYLLADGFGPIDLAFAREASFDWSHVRDSSPEAIRRISDRLRSAGLG